MKPANITPVIIIPNQNLALWDMPEVSRDTTGPALIWISE